MPTPTPTEQIAAVTDAAAEADRTFAAALVEPAQELRHAADVHAWAVAAHQVAPLDEARYNEMETTATALTDAQAAYAKALKTARAARTKALNEVLKA